jgi:hypothetical protein
MIDGLANVAMIVIGVDERGHGSFEAVNVRLDVYCNSFVITFAFQHLQKAPRGNFKITLSLILSIVFVKDG